MHSSGRAHLRITVVGHVICRGSCARGGKAMASYCAGSGVAAADVGSAGEM